MTGILARLQPIGLRRLQLPRYLRRPIGAAVNYYLSTCGLSTCIGLLLRSIVGRQYKDLVVSFFIAFTVPKLFSCCSVLIIYVRSTRADMIEHEECVTITLKRFLFLFNDTSR